jgi:hypothetical protein
LESDCTDFYADFLPSFPQQGDIYPNVPLINLPPSPNLVIVRRPTSHTYDDELPLGQVEAVRELLVDAFDGHPEYVVASAQRAAAVIVTQTCDLQDTSYWLACPLLSVAGSGVDRGNLFSGRYTGLFAMCPHPGGYFEESYVDLASPRPVRREALALADRIAALSPSTQERLTDSIAVHLSRPWGFGPGEEVAQTGTFRCLRCFLSIGAAVPELTLTKGERFPDCEGCLKFRKRAQWRLLVKRRR